MKRIFKATLMSLIGIACLSVPMTKAEAAEAEIEEFTPAIVRDPSVWGIAYTDNDVNMTGYFVSGGQWRHSSKGWWYQFSDGTYVQDAYVIIYNTFGEVCTRTSWEEVSTPDISAYLNEMSGRLEKRQDICGWQTIPVGGVYTESYTLSPGDMGEAQVHETDTILDMDIYHFDKDGYMSQAEYIKQGVCNYLYVNEKGLVQTGVLNEPDQKITYRWWSSKRPKSEWFGDTWRKSENDYNGCWYARNEWLKINGNWYAFNSAGYWAESGWNAIDGAWYYIEGGQCQTGWITAPSKPKYYCNASGKMVTGWKKISGEWYFFKPDGSMTTGWRKIRGEWYYFNNNGEAVTEWVKSGKAWYYCIEGKMVTGEQVVDGTTYVFDTNGKLLKTK